VDLLAERGIPWTLTYAPARPAVGAPPLPATVDLATRGDGSRAPCGLPAAEQARIVAAAVESTRRAWPDRTPRGYAPPGGRIDDGTAAALGDAGFEYVFASADALQPDVVWTRSSSLLVRIPRAEDAPPPDRRAALERASTAGGLYTLALDDDLLATPGAVDALRDLLDAARRDDPWVAPAADVAAWWRRRARVVASAEAPDPHRVVVRLSNVGDEPVDDLAVRLQLPEPAARVDLELAHWRRTRDTDYQVRHTPGSDEVVVVAHLPPGANEVLHLEWP
jgi:hypothetical protein